MTVYLRPLNIDHLTRIDSKLKEQYNNNTQIMLVFSHSSEQNGKYSDIIKYQLNDLIKPSSERPQYGWIGLNCKNWLKITLQDIRASNTKFDDATINLSSLMPTQSCDKEDIRTKQLSIGQYLFYYQYKCNRFLQICGSTVHKSICVQPNPKTFENSQIKTFKEYKESYKANDKTKAVPTTNAEPEREQKGGKRQYQLLPQSKVSTSSKKNKEVEFYVGKCATTNAFSCLDPSAELKKEREFKFIEQPFN